MDLLRSADSGMGQSYVPPLDCPDRFWVSMSALIRNTHAGKTKGIHWMVPMLNNSVAAKAKPRNPIHRCTIPVRSRIVDVENMKTPAILIP